VVRDRVVPPGEPSEPGFATATGCLNRFEDQTVLPAGPGQFILGLSHSQC
jgi:hypothetical protein